MSRPIYDEMCAGDGALRPHYQDFSDWLKRTPAEQIAQKREEAERAFHRIGITFAVYGEDAGTERLIPFDIVPRIIPAAEWRTLERGLKQRVQALNCFLHDIYHDHNINSAGHMAGYGVLASTGEIHALIDRGGQIQDLGLLGYQASDGIAPQIEVPTNMTEESTIEARRP